MKPETLKAALSPYLDKLLAIVGDAAGIILLLAFVYLLYAMAHNIADLLEKKESRSLRAISKSCRVLIDVLIYLIACLYALEYVMMKGGLVT